MTLRTQILSILVLAITSGISKSQVVMSYLDAAPRRSLDRYALDGNPSGSSSQTQLLSSLTLLGDRLLGGSPTGILEYDLSGNFVGDFGVLPSNDRESFPFLESDVAGNAYVSYRGPPGFRLDSAGNITQTYSVPNVRSIAGIDAASDGTTYILGDRLDDNRLFVFDSMGTLLDDFEIAETDTPREIAINESLEELYIGSEFPGDIHVYDISTSVPRFTETIPFPGEQLVGIYVDQETDRIFGTMFRNGGFEVDRDGTILNTYPLQMGTGAIPTNSDIVAFIPEPESLNLMAYGFITLIVLCRCGRAEKNSHHFAPANA